jgi:hypothetical protein
MYDDVGFVGALTSLVIWRSSTLRRPPWGMEDWREVERDREAFV